MREDRRMGLCAALGGSAKAALSALALATCGFVSIAFADDLQSFRNVGDGYKAVKIITRYEIHADKKTMDLFAKEPNDPSLSREVRVRLAGQTARDICANRTLKAGWTVRMFLPDESSPAVSCRTGAARGHAR